MRAIKEIKFGGRGASRSQVSPYEGRVADLIVGIVVDILGLVAMSAWSRDEYSARRSPTTLDIIARSK
jgi:hypothetical protein